MLTEVLGIFYVSAASSNGINKSECNVYAALPVLRGHRVLLQGTLQRGGGVQAAKPGVASQRCKCLIHLGTMLTSLKYHFLQGGIYLGG